MIAYWTSFFENMLSNETTDRTSYEPERAKKKNALIKRTTTAGFFFVYQAPLISFNPKDILFFVYLTLISLVLTWADFSMSVP